MNEKEIITDILNLLTEEFIPEPINQETQIITEGLLDSFSLMLFVEKIEGQFHISFNSGEINITTFSTPKTIAEFIIKKINERD